MTEDLTWRYYDNLYAMFDRLRARFPRVVFQNCAGGGGRLDWGTMARFHTVELSDWMRLPRGVKILNGVTMSLPPEALLRTFGTVRWSGTNADQVRQALELLSITVTAGMPKIALPVAIAAPDDLSATVTIEPLSQGVVDATGAPVLVVRNDGGMVTSDTLLPGATVLGSVMFLPLGDGVVLTWDLSLLKN